VPTVETAGASEDNIPLLLWLSEFALVLVLDRGEQGMTAGTGVYDAARCRDGYIRTGTAATAALS
jgi:hypothetical protein